MSGPGRTWTYPSGFWGSEFYRRIQETAKLEKFVQFREGVWAEKRCGRTLIWLPLALLRLGAREEPVPALEMAVNILCPGK